MTKDEALRLALDALESGVKMQANRLVWIEYDSSLVKQAITTIKAALEAKDEPVGKFAKFTDGIWREVTDGSAGVPLYTTPPQRTWVGLTDEERQEIYLEVPIDAVLITEAKLKEKNT